jgi:hypothetical protein
MAMDLSTHNTSSLTYRHPQASVTDPQVNQAMEDRPAMHQPPPPEPLRLPSASLEKALEGEMPTVSTFQVQCNAEQAMRLVRVLETEKQ